jgi:hypothetical protein
MNLWHVLILLFYLGTTPTLAAAASRHQTIVFIRHGEKPAEGLGQLNCQGLNRALALSQVLIKRFGTPDYIFAPDPRQQKADNGHDYDYVRPFATIEPTAIRAGKPVNTQFGFKEIDALRQELIDPRYFDAIIFVSWEHSLLVELVKDLLVSAGEDKSLVPTWEGSDFDSIYVLRFARDGNKMSVKFEHEFGGLNDQEATCP